MSYTPHLRREGGYTYGGYLKHYRTKGSRNGYSNDPNYKPVGQRAQGKLINGKYVYEDAKAKSSNRLNGNNGVIYEKRIKEKIIPEKRTFEKRTPSPSKPIRTQPQQKQNWFQRGVSNVGKAATSAGNWLGDRGRDAGNAVGKAASNAGRSIGKAATSAGNWIGDRGRDAGKAVGKAAGDASKWAGDRARDVGKAAANVSKAVGKTAKNVKENITGENYQLHKANKRHLDYQTRFATDDLRNPVFSYQSQSRAKKASAANKAGDASAQELMDKSYKTGKEYREWVQKNADKQRAYAGRSVQEKKAMDSTLDGKIANARKSLSDSRKNASKWISDRFGEAKTTAKKAGEAVGSAASKAGEAVGKAAKDTWEFTKPGGTLDRAAVDTAKKTAKNVKGFVTGDSTKTADQEYDSAKSAAKSVNKAGAQKMKKVLGESRDRYYDAFDDALSKNTNRHNEKAHANTIKKNSTDKINSLIKERDEKLKKAQDGREKTYIRNQYGEKIDDAKKEARINITEANRKSSRAGKDFEQAKSNIKKVRRQNAINEAKAENEVRISNVEANRRAAQARKEKEEAHNKTLPGMISNTSKAASDFIDNIVYGKNKKKSKKK